MVWKDLKSSTSKRQSCVRIRKEKNMKKMNLKKMATMVIATMMLMSTMCMSVMAKDSMEGMATIFNYNAETNTFDVSYVEESRVPALLSYGDPFNFSQNINSTYSYLVNTTNDNQYMDSRHINVTDNRAIKLTLTSYDKKNSYYFKMFQGTGFTYIPVADGVTPILPTPTCYFTGLTQGQLYSIQLKKDGSSYMTTGTLETCAEPSSR